MRKHEITENDVVLQNGTMFEMSLGFGFEQRWKFALVTAVARHFSCEAVGLWRGNGRKAKIVGPRENATRVLSLFTLLLNEIGFAVKGERRSPPDELVTDLAVGISHNLRSYLRSFHEGMTVFIVGQLTEQPPCSTAPSMSRELVLNKGSKVMDYIRSKFKSLKKLPPDRGEFDELAFRRGFAEGSQSRKLWQLLERK